MDRMWLKAWCGALLVCGMLAGGYEWFLRERGYVPTVQDDADLWSIQYDRIRSSPDAVALLGASRVEFGIDPALLSRELGKPVAMLAVNGKYPLAMLRALAEDPRYAGLVIVGIDSRGLQRKHWDMQQPEIDHLHKRWTLARRIHRELLTLVQERLVLSQSVFSITALVGRWLTDEGWPSNQRIVLRDDRAGSIDFHHPGVPTMRRTRIDAIAGYYRSNRPPPADVWLADLAQVSEWVRRIQQRGGNVIFFREPVAGESLALDEANFPRDQYWDAYARRSPAIMIDFRDIAGLSTLSLPDTSHIDGADVPRLTLELAQLLKHRGV